MHMATTTHSKAARDKPNRIPRRVGSVIEAAARLDGSCVDCVGRGRLCNTPLEHTATILLLLSVTISPSSQPVAVETPLEANDPWLIQYV